MLCVYAPKLILSLSTLGAALGAATLASPQVLAGPVPGAQFALLLPALVSSPETLTRSRTVVVAVALRSEMDNLLLAALASFDHLLLALARARTRLVAGHVFLTCHDASCICSTCGDDPNCWSSSARAHDGNLPLEESCTSPPPSV